MIWQVVEAVEVPLHSLKVSGYQILCILWDVRDEKFGGVTVPNDQF